MVDQARQRQLDANRRWREQNADRIREYRERTKPQRAAYEAANREKILEQKRQAERRRTARLKAQEAQRERDRDRARAWQQANPERVRERQREWTEKNREKVRAAQRAYYHRNREDRLEAMRERNAQRRKDPMVRAKERAYRLSHRDDLNAQQTARRSTPEGRAKHNLDQRERRQREKRRRELGLPPRPRHRSTISERAANAAAAAEFFTRVRSSRELRRLQRELAAVRAEKHEVESRDQLATDERAHAREQLHRQIGAFLESPASGRLREEVRMDAIARTLRGLTPYDDLEGETRRRAEASLRARRLRPSRPLEGRADRVRVVSEIPSAGPLAVTALDRDRALGR
ncbi:hypothetical protein [Microbacterium rhizophilus]|uniref:hypothetical protein n=1 Tax=Microbacterium rhizophilus TaxID=3138934 RepID=UPI0031EDBBF1